MSVWSNYGNGPALPPGTPNIEVRRAPQGGVNVLVAGKQAHGPVDYQAARLWVQNTYRLTGTMYLPVHADYEASLPPPEAEPAPNIPDVRPPNKYRKQVTG